MGIPAKISPCPIQEAVLEVRYRASVPDDAILGVVYRSLDKLFGDGEPETLPIMQLPTLVRRDDPNLRYQAHYRFRTDGYVFNLGPRAFSFSALSPYPGWAAWSQFFEEGFRRIQQSEVVDHVERVGLRYINAFDLPILPHVDISIAVSGQTLGEEPTQLRTQINDAGFMKILQVGNRVDISANGREFEGSIVDIDCIHRMDLDSAPFFDTYREIVETAHEKEKGFFFALLKDEFVESLNPFYGGL